MSDFFAKHKLAVYEESRTMMDKIILSCSRKGDYNLFIEHLVSNLFKINFAHFL